MRKRIQKEIKTENGTGYWLLPVDLAEFNQRCNQFPSVSKEWLPKELSINEQFFESQQNHELKCMLPSTDTMSAGIL